MRICWLLLGLVLGCSPSDPSPVHAEALVGAGQVKPASVGALLAGQPVSVDGPGLDGRWRVVASHQALADLRARGLDVEILRADHRRGGRLPSYHDQDAMIAALQGLAEAYPEQAEYVALGRSAQGRPIGALRVGEGDWTARILAAHHGDELTSSELALAVAERLLAEPLPVEVWIVPQVNPDGVAEGSRYNARQVDLNRNYGYKWSEAEYRAGEAPFSEPETRAVQVLSSYRSFASGLSMHAGAALICYVWNYTTEDSADEALLLAQSEAYRQACEADGFYLINGGAWYITYGDTTDWSYGQLGTLDYTLEVSVEKTPPASQLPGIIDDHMAAVRAFLARTPAVVGSVTDAVTGVPLEATVAPEGHQAGVCGPDGRFARWLPAGEQRLVVLAPGFASQTISVEIVAGATAEVSVALEREDLLELSLEPRLLTWGDEPRALRIEGLEDPSVTLWRPGYPAVTAAREGDAYLVTPSALAPGPWGVTASAGSAPRALFVGERSDRVRLRSVEWREGELWVEGEGFGAGSRAWLIAGEARGLEPLPVLAESEESLRIGAETLARASGVLDLLVVSDGAQLAALDLGDGVVVDTAAPSDSEPPAADSDTALPPVPGGGQCGCAASSTRGVAPALFLVTLASVFARRRRRRNPCRCRVSVGIV